MKKISILLIAIVLLTACSKEEKSASDVSSSIVSSIENSASAFVSVESSEENTSTIEVIQSTEEDENSEESLDEYDLFVNKMQDLEYLKTLTTTEFDPYRTEYLISVNGGEFCLPCDWESIIGVLTNGLTETRADAGDGYTYNNWDNESEGLRTYCETWDSGKKEAYFLAGISKYFGITFKHDEVSDISFDAHDWYVDFDVSINDIHLGQTLEEVINILGAPDECNDYWYNHTRIYDYHWSGLGGGEDGFILASFDIDYDYDTEEYSMRLTGISFNFDK